MIQCTRTQKQASGFEWNGDKLVYTIKLTWNTGGFIHMYVPFLVLLVYIQKLCLPFCLNVLIKDDIFAQIPVDHWLCCCLCLILIVCTLCRNKLRLASELRHEDLCIQRWHLNKLIHIKTRSPVVSFFYLCFSETPPLNSFSKLPTRLFERWYNWIGFPFFSYAMNWKTYSLSNYETQSDIIERWHYRMNQNFLNGQSILNTKRITTYFSWFVLHFKFSSISCFDLARRFHFKSCKNCVSMSLVSQFLL